MRRSSIAATLSALLVLATPAAADDLVRLASGNCGNCDLRGANLSYETLTSVDLTNANLSGADLSNADLTGALLDHANLQGAHLHNADLSAATLTYANLDDADLSDATVWAADFTGASLKGTDVTGTDFSQALHADLSAAVDRQPRIAQPAPPKIDNADLRYGSVFLIATGYCPQGTLDADGRSLTIQDNQILYSLYGITYGSDGATDFKLPDLRQQVPLSGLRYCVVNAGTYPPRY